MVLLAVRQVSINHLYMHTITTSDMRVGGRKVYAVNIAYLQSETPHIRIRCLRQSTTNNSMKSVSKVLGTKELKRGGDATVLSQGPHCLKKRRNCTPLMTNNYFTTRNYRFDTVFSPRHFNRLHRNIENASYDSTRAKKRLFRVATL